MRSIPIATGSLPRRRSAFTLIELVTAMSVGVVISGTAASLIWSASRIRAETSARVELTDTAAAAMEQFVRYVREIGQDECPGAEPPCLLGRAQIQTATSNEIRFGGHGFRRLDGTLQLTVDQGATWHVVASDVSNFVLTYHDRSGGMLSSLPLSETDRHKVRRIHAQLELARGTSIARVRTGIYLRSFLDEMQSDPQ